LWDEPARAESSTAPAKKGAKSKKQAAGK